jgi:hypothetical protein
MGRNLEQYAVTSAATVYWAGAWEHTPQRKGLQCSVVVEKRLHFLRVNVEAAIKRRATGPSVVTVIRTNGATQKTADCPNEHSTG